MTSATRTTIEASDFIAVELECSNCHHRVVRRMGIWKSILYSCPDCGSNWSEFHGTMKYLANLASQLPKFMPPDGEKWPFTIRFEISTDKKP
jgi:hypothetical protein